MNISSEIFPTDESNFSDYFIYNTTNEETGFALMAMNIITVLFNFPINSYVIWLMATGTGNGLAAEFFSLNLIVCEMLFCMQCLLNLINYRNLQNLWTAGLFFNSLGIMGCPLFQCLICIERYLAVVYPIHFLKYKPLRYRGICSVITWVATFVFSLIYVSSVFLFLNYFIYIFIMGHFSLCLSIQLFCLVAILRALKQSGPGERARERNEENLMKRRAFYIILIIAVSMLIKFLPYMIVMSTPLLVYNTETAVCIGYVCFSFAGLAQPLLFLNRVRKLPLIKCQ